VVHGKRIEALEQKDAKETKDSVDGTFWRVIEKHLQGGLKRQ
jgi:hypothetical protein